MVRFNLNEKNLQIFNCDEQILEVELISSTVTNKFFIITNFIENISKTCEGFDDWFCNFLMEYTTEVERYLVIEKNIPIIKKYVDEYLAIRNIDISKFVDETKAKKTSILFSIEEIEKIMRLSCYLKIYSLISNSDKLKLDARLHKKVYNEFASEVLFKDSEVISKIFNMISTKTFRYNLTDKYMWDYIKMIHCKTIDVHIIEIFNFIMNSILILCEEDKNPIIYFSSVVTESINWFLRSVYKSQIIYDDTVSTEDIHGSTVDNLKTYTYNDTLGRLKGIAFEQIYDNLERSSILLFSNETTPDQSIVDFQNRISKIEYISPLCDSLVYPILSKITSIPYIHFKTLTPDHAIVLAVYTQNLLRKTFSLSEYKNLFSLLSYYPKKEIAIATTYKVKAMEEFVNLSQSVNNFFGFGSKLLFGNMLGYFIGRISRVEFTNIFDGNELAGVPLSRIELEMIQFYAQLFGSKFEKEFDQMEKLMQKDF